MNTVGKTWHGWLVNSTTDHSNEEVRATLAKEPVDVAQMFNTVAKRYDLMNALLSLGQERGWRVAVTEAIDPQPGERVLDVAGGTGTSALPLARCGAQVEIVDLSQGMIETGRQRLSSDPAGHLVNFRVGDATRLPFDDATFDVVTSSFGLRNVQQPELALREMRRVTKPGGRIVICEFSHPVRPLLRAAYRFWLGEVIPAASRIGSNPSGYGYLTESILAWPDQENLVRLLLGAQWSHVQFRNLSGGIVALHRGSAV
jgi:demethylmenaquinone methyltransferase/2-methoxy-6-polyprenyl-1,4-benzoquinol methylase